MRPVFAHHLCTASGASSWPACLQQAAAVAARWRPPSAQPMASHAARWMAGLACQAPFSCYAAMDFCCRATIPSPSPVQSPKPSPVPSPRPKPSPVPSPSPKPRPPPPTGQPTCNPELCIECASSGQWCNSCIDGYGPGTDGSCIPCQLGQCTSCASHAWTCWGCEVGYSLDGSDGTCVP
jgi:hypothetical protein